MAAKFHWLPRLLGLIIFRPRLNRCIDVLRMSNEMIIVLRLWHSTGSGSDSRCLPPDTQGALAKRSSNPQSAALCKPCAASNGGDGLRASRKRCVAFAQDPPAFGGVHPNEVRVVLHFVIIIMQHRDHNVLADAKVADEPSY